MKKSVFLIGAGTELYYKLPNGDEYIKSTIFTKKEKMYKSLKNFYDSLITNKGNSYTEQYSEEFHLRKDSTEIKKVFNEIANILLNKGLEDIVNKFFVSSVINNETFYTINENEFHEIIAEGTDYDELLKEKPYLEHIHTTGFIHRNFPTIINPKNTKNKSFWSLVNYFWSCYFTILLPILENTPKYCNNMEFLNNKYEYVLDNLEEIIDYLYGHDFKELITSNGYNVNNLCNYYQIIKKCEVNNIITANYTPFAECYFDNVCYLAGKLNEFEFPQTFEIRSTNLKGMFFPYLSTQVPIKPLVHPKQIKQYSKAISQLNNCNKLFILGYSLGALDDHINAIICDYIRCGGNIVYFEFVKDFNESYLLNYVSDEYINTANLIRISKNYYKRLKVYKFNGSEEQFVSILELEGLKNKEKELAYVR